MKFKFEKLVNKINKAGYDVSIMSCKVDSGNIEYQPEYGLDNGICIYGYNKEVIEKIQNIALNMKRKTIIKLSDTPIKIHEIFVY